MSLQYNPKSADIINCNPICSSVAKFVKDTVIKMMDILLIQWIEDNNKNWIVSVNILKYIHLFLCGFCCWNKLAIL